MKVLFDVSHHLEGELRRENAGILRLFLFKDIRLHGTTNGGEDPRFDIGILFWISGATFFTSKSMAAFRNIASIIGAGPFIVNETEVFGSARSNP